jgi:AcrR family transcriptional regulator
MTGASEEPLVKGTPQREPSDGRRARGMRSRSAVLKRSVQMASREGLEGLTIGALAADLGVHKSSVHALFGSKEELQLATLATARAILIEQVIVPALSSEPGLRRLEAIGEAWCHYLAADVFSGGCFLCAASAEMDGRPGPLRDAVASVMGEWISVLRANIEAAITAGGLRADVDTAPMAFRLNALGMAANWQRQLLRDPSGVAHARAGWRAELDRHRPDGR